VVEVEVERVERGDCTCKQKEQTTGARQIVGQRTDHLESGATVVSEDGR